jgi:hypothetical protein
MTSPIGRPSTSADAAAADDRPLRLEPSGQRVHRRDGHHAPGEAGPDYELAVDTQPTMRVAAAFTELAQAI